MILGFIAQKAGGDETLNGSVEKQTAVLQSWDSDFRYEKAARKTGSYFRVARTGSYYPVDGTSPIKLKWYAVPARHSEIYLFASHEVSDVSANHFDPAQWKFYLLDARKLDEQKSISLEAVKGKAVELAFTQLGDEVNSLANQLMREPSPDTLYPTFSANHILIRD